jgi:poly-gamma-glutamate synthesis protein (capsule biosynthesis protein)
MRTGSRYLARMSKLWLLPLILIPGLLSPLAVSAACLRSSSTVRLSFVGDILVHQALFEHAVRSPDRFQSLWKTLIPTFQDADLMVGNLEGAVAPGRTLNGPAQDPGFRHDGKVYSGTNFLFNYHPYLLDDLAASGFDLLSTANNHSMDRGPVGVDATLAQIQKRQLGSVGTRSSQTQQPNDQDYLKKAQVKNIHFGFIACAENLNGFSDKKDQVLSCGSPRLLKLISQSQAAGLFTIVLPHWGFEYQPLPSSIQRRWAKAWVSAGADVIVGNHPHVLQTIEWFKRDDGHSAVVIYSLGNFIAGQRDIRRRASAVLHLDIKAKEKKSYEQGGKLSSLSYTPVLRPNGSYGTRLARPDQDREEMKIIREQLGSERCNLN